MPGRGPRKPEHIAKKLAKMKAQYALLTEEQKAAIKEKVNARRASEEGRAADVKRHRRWYLSRTPEQKAKDLVRTNRRMTAWYHALTPEQKKKHNQERYQAHLVNREINWGCSNGCDVITKHPTGLCVMCRMTTCRKCNRSLEQTYLGQRVHEKCAPKVPDVMLF